MGKEPKNQIERFRQAARELETNEDEAAFNEKLGKIARQKPSDESSKKNKDDR